MLCGQAVFTIGTVVVWILRDVFARETSALLAPVTVKDDAAVD